MNKARIVLAAAGLVVCGTVVAVADQFVTPLGGPSYGTVVERRQGTTGNANVPVDENNPLPVTTVGGGSTAGSVGTAGTNGTTAQSVQGITGGVPVPVTASSLPLPTGAATAAGQATPVASGASTFYAMPVQGVSGGYPEPVLSSPNTRTLVPLDVATVTTGGTAVTALTAGHATAGGFVVSGAAGICVNEIGTATTITSGNTVCVSPGQVYNIIPTTNAVSVNSTASATAFGGYGEQ